MHEVIHSSSSVVRGVTRTPYFVRSIITVTFDHYYVFWNTCNVNIPFPRYSAFFRILKIHSAKCVGMGQNVLSKHSSVLFEKCIGRYFSLQREEEEEEEEEEKEEEEEEVIIRNSTFFERCTWIVFNLEENLEGKFVPAVRSSVRSDVIRNRGASGLFYGAERISR